MAGARAEHNWALASSIIANVVNCWSRKKFNPSDFNPLAKKTVLPKTNDLSILKEAFHLKGKKS